MTRLNAIQSAILSLDGGEYHNLLDEYLYKKFNLDNIHSLGVQTATNKSTKGIPDSYIENEEGTYTLIMYGTVRDNPYKKLKEDIESSLESYKEEIEQGEIKEIIAAYTSTNIDPYQLEELKALNGNVDIKLIGLSTLSQDLLLRYPRIALDHLNIPIDSEQIFSIKDFIKRYDSNQVNAPLSVPFGLREEEQEKI